MRWTSLCLLDPFHRKGQVLDRKFCLSVHLFVRPSQKINPCKDERQDNCNVASGWECTMKYVFFFFDKLTNFSCHPTFWSQLSSRQSCVWETMQNGVRHSSSVLEQRENDEGGIAKIFAADLSKVYLLLCQVSSPKNYGPPSDHWGALFKQKMSDLRRMLHDPKPLQLICFHFVLFFWFWNASKGGVGVEVGVIYLAKNW